VSRLLFLVTLLVAGGAARTYASTTGSTPRGIHLTPGATTHRLPERSGIPTTPRRSHARRTSRLSCSALRHSRNLRTGTRSGFFGQDSRARLSPTAQGLSLRFQLSRKQLFLDASSGRGPPRASPELFALFLLLPLVALLILPRFSQEFLPPPKSAPSEHGFRPRCAATPEGPLCASLSRPSLGERT